MKKLFRTPSNRQSKKETNHKRVVYTYFGEPPPASKYINWISDTAAGAQYTHDDSETHRAVCRMHKIEDATVYEREEIYDGENVFVKETVIRRDTDVKSSPKLKQISESDYDLPCEDGGTDCAKSDAICVISKAKKRQSVISRTSIASTRCFSPNSIENMKRRPLPEIPVNEETDHDKTCNDMSSSDIHVNHKEIYETKKLKCHPSNNLLNTPQSEVFENSTGECNDQNATSTSSSFLHIGIPYDEEKSKDSHLDIPQITPELREENYVDPDEANCRTYDDNSSNGPGPSSDDSIIYDFCVTPVYRSAEDHLQNLHKEIRKDVSGGFEENRANMNELSNDVTNEDKERQSDTVQCVEYSEQNFRFPENSCSKKAVLHCSSSYACKPTEADEPSETYEDVDYEETTYLSNYIEVDEELQNLRSRNSSLDYMNENNQAKIAARREINERLKKDLENKIKLAELEQEERDLKAAIETINISRQNGEYGKMVNTYYQDSLRRGFTKIKDDVYLKPKISYNSSLVNPDSFKGEPELLMDDVAIFDTENEDDYIDLK